MKLVEMTVQDYMEQMASDAPAPGGGSASALCGAQGSGLVRMVAALTVGNQRYADRHSDCSAVMEKGGTLMEELLLQVDEDTQAFEQVSAAFKLPKGTEAEKAARSQAIQAGTVTAAEVPLKTMAIALSALRNARQLLDGFNTNAASDLGVAALELAACVRGAWLNVLINIGSIKDQTVVENLRSQGKNVVAEADQLADEIYQAVLKLIET